MKLIKPGDHVPTSKTSAGRAASPALTSGGTPVSGSLPRPLTSNTKGIASRAAARTAAGGATSKTSAGRAARPALTSGGTTVSGSLPHPFTCNTKGMALRAAAGTAAGGATSKTSAGRAASPALTSGGTHVSGSLHRPLTCNTKGMASRAAAGTAAGGATSKTSAGRTASPALTLGGTPVSGSSCSSKEMDAAGSQGTRTLNGKNMTSRNTLTQMDCPSVGKIIKSPENIIDIVCRASYLSDFQKSLAQLGEPPMLRSINDEETVPKNLKECVSPPGDVMDIISPIRNRSGSPPLNPFAIPFIPLGELPGGHWPNYTTPGFKLRPIFCGSILEIRTSSKDCEFRPKFRNSFAPGRSPRFTNSYISGMPPKILESEILGKPRDLYLISCPVSEINSMCSELVDMLASMLDNLRLCDSSTSLLNSNFPIFDRDLPVIEGVG